MTPSQKLVPPGVALLGVTAGLARYAYGLFLPSIREDLALTPALSGLVAGGSYAGYCIAIIAAALLSERLGPRSIAALAGLVAVVGMASIAVAASPLFLAAAVLFAGMSSGLASPPLAEAVAVRIAPAQQGGANTLINSGTSAGVALSGPVALAYVEAWREAYLLFAVLAAGVTWWVWRTLPACAAPRGVAEPDVTVRLILRPAAWTLALAAFGVGASSAIYWTFASETMIEVGGLPASITSTAWVVLGLAGFAGGAAGGLVERHGVNTVHRASLMALAAAVVSIGLLPGAVAVAYIAAALFGAAYIMLTGVYLVWGVRVFADRPAIGLGLPFLMINLGQAAGAAIAGLAIGTFGHPVAFTLFAGLALATMLARPMGSELTM